MRAGWEEKQSREPKALLSEELARIWDEEEQKRRKLKSTKADTMASALRGGGRRIGS